MFYLVGIGLYDEKDITVKGLEIVKRASRVYLEYYTSVIWKNKNELEAFYGKDLTIADREMVEVNSDDILRNADIEEVVLLVAGDPFAATTHTDLVLRAKSKNINTQIIHNASIFNAVGCCGLQLYHYGETVSIPYWTETWRPDSFLKKIDFNFTANLHTLCLLDIQVKEPTPESIIKKMKTYLPPRFMSVKEAASQLLELVLSGATEVLTEETLVIGVARVGAVNQQITACSLIKMSQTDLGPPLHSLVIPAGKLHPIEEEYLTQFLE